MNSERDGFYKCEGCDAEYPNHAWENGNEPETWDCEYCGHENENDWNDVTF